MPSVTIYTSPLCGFCCKKGAAFQEIDISRNPDRRQEMMRLARGRHTAPQIFINVGHVGGCDALHDLDRRGKPDRRLAG